MGDRKREHVGVGLCFIKNISSVLCGQALGQNVYEKLETDRGHLVSVRHPLWLWRRRRF